MDIKIQSVNFSADQSLNSFVEERVQKLTQYFDNIIACEAFLKVDKKAASGNKISEIKLSIPGKELFAKKKCDSFEEATDLVVSALIRQLRKHKGKTVLA